MSRVGIAAWTVALAIMIAGCDSGDRDRGDVTAGSAGTSGATAAAAADANDPATMTVTGCLERGSGSDFVLTRLDTRPRQEGPAAAYRLSGGPDNLRNWVGHQVRVTGKLEDRGGVQSPDANRQVREGEPAKLEVTSAESVGDACGQPRQ